MHIWYQRGRIQLTSIDFALSRAAPRPVSGKLRLTNLMKLTLDTSWYTRYRSSSHNPDLDPGFVFPQAVPGLASGQFTAIPRTDADLAPDAHIQAMPIPLHSTCRRLNKVVAASILPWHRGPTA